MSYTLRPYQQRCVNDCINYIQDKKNKKKVIVISPVGSGKSLEIAAVVNSVKEPVIILCPNRDILKQNYSKYIAYGNEASIYSASLKSREITHVTYATIGSIKKEVNAIKALGVKLLLVDEAHIGTKNESQISKFIEQAGIEKVIGFSGTPIELGSWQGQSYLKMINRSRKNLFQQIIHCTQIAEIKDQYWTKMLYESRHVDTSKLHLNSTGNDYTESSLNEFYEYNSLKEKILHEVNRLQAEGRKSILVFVPSIYQANEVAQFIPNAACVHSKTEDNLRNQLTADFKNLTIPVMLNVDCFGVGFDHPELTAIIEARPTNSFVTWYQHGGRLVRPAEGKQNGKLICMSGNLNKFGKLEDIEFREDGGRWGMFSGNEQLTIGEVVKAKEIEFDGKIWFGQTHKGKELKNCPRHYVEWLVRDYKPFTLREKQMIEAAQKILNPAK